MFKLLDLTWPLAFDKVATWDPDDSFRLVQKLDYVQCGSTTKFQVQEISCKGGTGTHIDAPRHCFAEGKDIAGLELENLIVPVLVVDVTDQADQDYQLGCQEILKFESLYGTIPSHSFVIVRTGWDQHWHNAQKYRNDYKYPSISVDAAKLLLSRGIVGLGIDTLSPDKGEQFFCQESVHSVILGAGRFIVENVANSQTLPPKGAYIGVFPLKIVDAAESPIRLVGLLPLVQRI